jgi:hypothetical protein
MPSWESLRPDAGGAAPPWNPRHAEAGLPPFARRGAPREWDRAVRDEPQGTGGRGRPVPLDIPPDPETLGVRGAFT